MSLSNLTNSKSVLAKLLAQENITVEHSKIPTAAFDPKNRTLYLPVWKNMSSELYDLLVGHEVGHAWETPPEGWHTAIEEKGKGFKSFLNVVEDARIEKKIKLRYPGLRGPMYKGYQQLFEQDFFGTNTKPIAAYNLIDRLNLHFKIGSLLNVPFQEKEKHFVNRMEHLSSWEDVYELASELYQYQKENPTTSLDEFEDAFDKDADEGDWHSDYENYDDNDEFSDDLNERLTKSSRGGNNDPFSETDEKFREKEKTLLDESSYPFVYANLPRIDITKFVVDYKTLYSIVKFTRIDGYEDYIKECLSSKSLEKAYLEEADVFNRNTILNDYKEKNMKFIMYLVKEFELKRNAAQYARASVSKTGELDVEKVWAYKLKDDLFKRVTKIPHGKNHAMVMFVDWSGSMVENLDNTIEQTLVLTDFCRKVGIPFEVLAFSDTQTGFEAFFGFRYNEKQRYDLNPGDLYYYNSCFKLLNLISSRMSKNEYRNAQIRLLQIGKAYERVSGECDYNKRLAMNFRSHVIPGALSLGGTPLDEAIVVANQYIDTYKKINKIDVMNTIFLTDGEGSDSNFITAENGSPIHVRHKTKNNRHNFVLTDKESGISVSAKPGEKITSALLRMLKAKTDTNLVGYFISNRNIKTTVINLCNEYGTFVPHDTIQENIRKNKFFDLGGIGYDSYFVIQGKDLEIVGDQLEVDANAAKREVMKAFIKNQKRKLINRVLLNKFIERIA